MKSNPKAPWFVSSGNSSPKSPQNQFLLLYCPTCDIIWDLEGAIACPHCQGALSVVSPQNSLLTPSTLVKRFYCPTHGVLAAERVKFVAGRAETPAEGQKFGHCCSICSKTAFRASRRLCEAWRPFPEGFAE